ncbi:salivary glue protein Sgs-3-like isoform X2 [Macrobrachium nipponense]|uniref:salivary glue protein Sgs-3-like isoform X2 n=1 Tax=Macrobrachium nipponense TaxID=159736 RepID=UPI0030C89ED7
MARQQVALAVAFLLVTGVVCEFSTSTAPQTPSPTTIPNTDTTTTATTTTTTTDTPTTTTAATTTTETTTTETTHTTADTTTTTAPNTTTTTKTTHTTTTNATTNTTTKSPTTTETPTPIPKRVYYYNVTDDSAKNVTYCIIFEGEFNYNITYEATSKEGKTSNKTASITSPKHPQEGAVVTGSCGKSQFLAFDWESGKHNITMDFSKSSDGKTWGLNAVTANIFMDPKTFPDAVNANKTLTIVAHFDLRPSDIPVNTSYSCISSFKSDNVTGAIDGETSHGLEITAVLGQDFQLEAYNLMAHGNFTTATICPKTTIIPIIVGCVLAGVVLVVLVIYMAGRRRRSSTYESI